MAKSAVTPCCKQLLDPQLALMASMLLSRMRGRDLLENRKAGSRRLVCGLREVKDVIQSGIPVLAVFIAYDIGENIMKRRCPARDAGLIMDAALDAGVPVSFALSRRDTGDALGHPHLISAVAVLSACGEEALFGAVMQLSVKLCSDFVDTLGNILTNNLLCGLVNCVSS